MQLSGLPGTCGFLGSIASTSILLLLGNSFINVLSSKTKSGTLLYQWNYFNEKQVTTDTQARKYTRKEERKRSPTLSSAAQNVGKLSSSIQTIKQPGMVVHTCIIQHSGGWDDGDCYGLEASLSYRVRLTRMSKTLSQKRKTNHTKTEIKINTKGKKKTQFIHQISPMHALSFLKAR